MTPGVHPLLRIALLVCPAEFRRHCGDELAKDLDPRREQPLSLAVTCLNVAWTGLCLHAENVWRDVAFAVRVLSKAPVFVTVAFLTIALAIGANVVAFSILKGMVLDPMPYPQGERLAFVSSVSHGEDQTNIDYPDAHDFALRSRMFSGIDVETQTSGALTSDGSPLELQGWYVGGDYFSILRARPRLGRLLSRADLGTRHVVISDSLWRSRFSANTAVLGRPIIIDDHPYTVVGVAPPHFYNPGPGFMAETDYWLPIDPRQYPTGWRSYYSFYAIGRLRDGVSWTQAQADLSRVATQLAQEYAKFDRHRGVRVRPLVEALSAPMRPIVLLLYAGAILILLIAAANVANLLLVRAAARERDLAVRSALGATRNRIAAQIAIEIGLIAVAGLAAGIGAASVCLRAVGAALQGLGQVWGAKMIVPGWQSVGIDFPIVCYGVLLTMGFALTAALTPAYLRATDAAALAGAGRVVDVARRWRTRAGLAVCEIVLAFAVVCIAGLLVQSFLRLERSPIGFREADVYAGQIDLPASHRYASDAAIERFYVKSIDALRALPGVASAAEAWGVGLGSNISTNYSLQRPIGTGNMAEQQVEFNSVSPTFFQTLGIPLVSGRIFSDGDSSHSQPVAIVSKSFALEHFHSITGALNHYVSEGDSTQNGFPMRRIVGVVGDVRHELSSSPAQEIYAPFAQVTFPGLLVVRTAGVDAHLASDAAAAISRIDPLLPPPQWTSLSQIHVVDDETNRMATAALLALAAIAVLLALAGVYSVVAYSVERRTHEFGIRMSLGAPRSSIAAHVFSEAALLCAIGIAGGSAVAVIAARGATQLLYETSPLDPIGFIAAGVIMVLTVVLAAGVPAMRATRVQPATALRYE